METQRPFDLREACYRSIDRWCEFLELETLSMGTLIYSASARWYCFSVSRMKELDVGLLLKCT